MARSSFGSEPESGPKCLVNSVQCSTSQSMSNKLRVGIFW